MQEVPQKETTPFYPRSPYGVAKLFAYWSVVNFREAYGMFACNGILFNHESPRRGETFVTRKITRSVAKIHLGQLDFFELGNLDSLRDWGHAKDYVECMWKILQLVQQKRFLNYRYVGIENFHIFQDTPEDFVIATGEMHSVREFVEASFRHIGKEIQWEGKGESEVGKEKDTGIVR